MPLSQLTLTRPRIYPRFYPCVFALASILALSLRFTLAFYPRSILVFRPCFYPRSILVSRPCFCPRFCPRFSPCILSLLQSGRCERISLTPPCFKPLASLVFCPRSPLVFSLCLGFRPRLPRKSSCERTAAFAGLQN